MKCRATIKSGPKKGKRCRRKIKKCKNALCGYHQTEELVNTKTVVVIDDTSLHNTFEVELDCMCVICLENNNPSESIALGCKHRFHLNCIVQIDGNCCSMCRSEIAGVPLYIATILKKNYDTDKKIKEMQMEHPVERPRNRRTRTRIRRIRTRTIIRESTSTRRTRNRHPISGRTRNRTGIQ